MQFSFGFEASSLAVADDYPDILLRQPLRLRTREIRSNNVQARRARGNTYMTGAHGITRKHHAISSLKPGS